MESTTTTNEDATQLVKKPTIFASYAELAKIRLSLLTVVTAGVGFVMASPLGVDWSVLGDWVVSIFWRTRRIGCNI